MKTNIYQIITDRILAQLEQGVVPWHQPWANVTDEEAAINYVTRKPYSLINQFLLGVPGEYLTFKQVNKLGGTVKKGAKAGMVVYYSTQTTKKQTKINEDGSEETVLTVKEYSIPILRGYYVFHIKDTVGIPSKIKTEELSAEPTIQPIERAESIVNGYLNREPALKFSNDKTTNIACYYPSADAVSVPMLSQYSTPEEYYATTFHELVHSTGHESRCNRTLGTSFASENYSREELVAEIGSAMICNSIKIECDKAFKNSIAYLQSWLSALKNDKKMIVWAASRAEKAVKYIIGEEE